VNTGREQRGGALLEVEDGDQVVEIGHERDRLTSAQPP
jgi:hypothetical protein